MADTPDRIPVGYVRRAHGLRGDVLLRPQSDDSERFVVGAQFMTDESPARSLEIVEIRSHAEGLLLRFAEIRDRTAAEELRGVTLTIAPEQRRELAEGEYWPEDLVGLAVFDLAGAHLGTVASVVTGGAQDRLVVSAPESVPVEVPFVAALVPVVDVAAGRIEMDPPPGLFV